jgi:hypothetical protein
MEETKIKFYNFIFECMINTEHPISKSFIKLDKCISGKSSFDFGVFQKKIVTSPEFTTYIDKRKELIKRITDEKVEEFTKTLDDDSEKNKKIESFKQTMMFNSSELPEWSKLLELESGLELERCKIYGRDIIYNYNNDIFELEKRCVVTDTNNNLIREDYIRLEPFIEFIW